MFKRKQGKMTRVNLDEILPNPNQPRREFEESGLLELAASIREYGVLQPISVRKVRAGYELVAGERRVRACRLAGLSEIPSIVLEIDNCGSAAVALIENLQREDLSFLDEANAYYNLVNDFGLTQEEVARRVGKSQATIANKLRILRMSGKALNVIVKANLTERHARALLPLESEELQLQAIAGICGRGLNVKQTEEYVAQILLAEQLAAEIDRNPPSREVKTIDFEPSFLEPPFGEELLAERQSISGAICDTRVLVRTLKRTVELLQRAGIRAEVLEKANDDYMEYVVRVAKN
ncbi:MAG: ParB/RepB/Spo0J family partition protein [Clostridiales bacterium]|jgi:ParB family chromosome partitioning protein|nr:ParB/RepB/Spo0J family partition protein [Clostridiales bacterium]